MTEIVETLLWTSHYIFFFLLSTRERVSVNDKQAATTGRQVHTVW